MGRVTVFRKFDSFRLNLIAALLCSVSCTAQAADVDICRKLAATLQIGMRRDVIEHVMEHDGGLSGVYRGERLYFTGLKPGEPIPSDWGNRKFCMVIIDFRPQAVPPEVYDDPDRFSSSIASHGEQPAPDDVVMRIGEPTLDYRHSD